MDWAARETFCSLSKAFSATRRFVLIPARFIGVFSSATSDEREGERFITAVPDAARHLESTALIPEMQSIHWTPGDRRSSLREGTTTWRECLDGSLPALNERTR